MTTGSAILANDGDGSVSGTTFHTYTACTQYLWWEKRLSPSRGSYCRVNKEQRALTLYCQPWISCLFVLYLVAWCSVKSSVADSRR